jgi:hypothetical protein
MNSWLTDGGEVVSLTRRPPFTPRKIAGTHFCRLSRPQGHNAAGRIRSIEESNDIGNRTKTFWLKYIFIRTYFTSIIIENLVNSHFSYAFPLYVTNPCVCFPVTWTIESSSVVDPVATDKDGWVLLISIHILRATALFNVFLLALERNPPNLVVLLLFYSCCSHL